MGRRPHRAWTVKSWSLAHGEEATDGAGAATGAAQGAPAGVDRARAATVHHLERAVALVVKDRLARSMADWKRTRVGSLSRPNWKWFAILYRMSSSERRTRMKGNARLASSAIGV